MRSRLPRSAECIETAKRIASRLWLCTTGIVGSSEIIEPERIVHYEVFKRGTKADVAESSRAVALRCHGLLNGTCRATE